MTQTTSAMKHIYLLIQSNADGSSSIRYVLDPNVIIVLQEAYDKDLIDYESAPGIDGDGFNYQTLNIPENLTAKDLGISDWSIYNMEQILSILNKNDVNNIFQKFNLTET